MARDQELPPREQEVAESVPEVVSCCAGNSPRRPVQVPPRPVMPPPRHAEVPQRPAPARIDVPARLRAEPAPHVNGPLDVLGKALLACVILNAALKACGMESSSNQNTPIRVWTALVFRLKQHPIRGLSYFAGDLGELHEKLDNSNLNRE